MLEQVQAKISELQKLQAEEYYKKKEADEEAPDAEQKPAKKTAKKSAKKPAAKKTAKTKETK